MFKKAFLSTLVSVFLTLSISIYATAFAGPTNPPPSGLASPTFGGLTIQGGPTFTNTQINLNGASLINGTLTDANKVIIADDINISGTTTATGLLTANGGLTSTVGTTNLGTTIVGVSTPATSNKDLTVNGNATLGIDSLTGTSAKTLDLYGNTNIGSTTYNKNLTVNGTLEGTGTGKFQRLESRIIGNQNDTRIYIDGDLGVKGKIADYNFGDPLEFVGKMIIDGAISEAQSSEPVVVNDDLQVNGDGHTVGDLTNRQYGLTVNDDITVDGRLDFFDNYNSGTIGNVRHLVSAPGEVFKIDSDAANPLSRIEFDNDYMSITSGSDGLNGFSLNVRDAYGTSFTKITAMSDKVAIGGKLTAGSIGTFTTRLSAIKYFKNDSTGNPYAYSSTSVSCDGSANEVLTGCGYTSNYVVNFYTVNPSTASSKTCYASAYMAAPSVSAYTRSYATCFDPSK